MPSGSSEGENRSSVRRSSRERAAVQRYVAGPAHGDSYSFETARFHIVPPNGWHRFLWKMGCSALNTLKYNGELPPPVAPCPCWLLPSSDEMAVRFPPRAARASLSTPPHCRPSMAGRPPAPTHTSRSASPPPPRAPGPHRRDPAAARRGRLARAPLPLPSRAPPPSRPPSSPTLAPVASLDLAVAAPTRASKPSSSPPRTARQADPHMRRCSRLAPLKQAAAARVSG